MHAVLVYLVYRSLQLTGNAQISDDNDVVNKSKF